MATLKLTETQTTVLNQAAYRPDGNIEPLPPTLKGGARTKVIDGLATRGLIAEQDGEYLLTDAGYAAVGRSRPKADPEMESAVATAEAQWQGQGVEGKARRTRENSKQAQVIGMLKRPEGATVAQIMAATGWLAHTVRGTFAGAFKKKLGLTITSEKPEGGERVYRIA